jgi:hypothetical protein
VRKLLLQNVTFSYFFGTEVVSITCKISKFSKNICQFVGVNIVLTRNLNN